METVKLVVNHRKKEMKVSLEFPEAADGKVIQDFETRLKEIYLRKVEFLSMQKKESALRCQSKEKQ